jgi:hypothetical protein
MAGETEVLEENLPRRHFYRPKSHLTRPGIETGPPRRGGKPTTNRFSYGAANIISLVWLTAQQQIFVVIAIILHNKAKRKKNKYD